MSTLSSNTYTYDRIEPKQPHCHGQGCYCFYGKSPLDLEDDMSDISSISSWQNDDGDENKLDEFTDLPPLVRSVIAPFLETMDTATTTATTTTATPPPPLFSCHLYFDEDGDEISFKEEEEEEETADCRTCRKEMTADEVETWVLADTDMGDLDDWTHPECEGCRAKPEPEPEEEEEEEEEAEAEEGDDNWAFALRQNGKKLTFYHPRVLLAYFRFVRLYNTEVVSRDEMINIPLIPTEIAQKLMSHSSIQNPPEEFTSEVNALVDYIYHYTKPE